MASSRHRFTAEDKRTIIAAYEDAPHGGKQAILGQYDLTYEQLRRWRSARDAGLLEVGGVPREIHMTPVSQSAELRHLRAQLARVEAERDRLQAQTIQQAGALDALGKATALLHELVTSTSADTPALAEPPSSTRSTPSEP